MIIYNIKKRNLIDGEIKPDINTLVLIVTEENFSTILITSIPYLREYPPNVTYVTPTSYNSPNQLSVQ